MGNVFQVWNLSLRLDFIGLYSIWKLQSELSVNGERFSNVELKFEIWIIFGNVFNL